MILKYWQKAVSVLESIRSRFWNIILMELDDDLMASADKVRETAQKKSTSKTSSSSSVDIPELKGPMPLPVTKYKPKKRKTDDRALPSYHESSAIPNLRIISTPAGNKLPQFNVFGQTDLPAFDTSRYLYSHFSENARDIKQTYPITTRADGSDFGTDYVGFMNALMDHFPGLFIGKPTNPKAAPVATAMFQSILSARAPELASVHVQVPQYMRKFIDLMYNQSDHIIEGTFLPDMGEWFRMIGTRERQLWRNLEDLFDWRNMYAELLVDAFGLEEEVPDLMLMAREVGVRIFPYERLSELKGNPDAGEVVTRISNGEYVSPDQYWREVHLQGNHFKRQQIAYNNYSLREMGIEKNKYLVYGTGTQGFSGKIQDWDAAGLGVRLEIPSVFFVASDEVETHGIYKAGRNCYFIVIPETLEETPSNDDTPLLTDQSDNPAAIAGPVANDAAAIPAPDEDTGRTRRRRRRAAATPSETAAAPAPSAASTPPVSDTPAEETPAERRRRLRRERRAAAAANE